MFSIIRVRNSFFKYLDGLDQLDFLRHEHSMQKSLSPWTNVDALYPGGHLTQTSTESTRSWVAVQTEEWSSWRGALGHDHEWFSTWEYNCYNGCVGGCSKMIAVLALVEHENVSQPSEWYASHGFVSVVDGLCIYHGGNSRQESSSDNEVEQWRCWTMFLRISLVWMGIRVLVHR